MISSASATAFILWKEVIIRKMRKVIAIAFTCLVMNLLVCRPMTFDGLVNPINFFPQVFDLGSFLFGLFLFLFRSKTGFGCLSGFWPDECAFQQGFHLFHNLLFIVKLGTVCL